MLERLKTNIRVLEGTTVPSYGFYQHLGGKEKQEDYGIVGYLPGFNELSDDERKEVFEEAFREAQKKNGQTYKGGATGLFITGWRKKEAKEGKEKLVVSSASLGDSRGIVVILDENKNYKKAYRVNRLHSLQEAKEQQEVQRKIKENTPSYSDSRETLIKKSAATFKIGIYRTRYYRLVKETAAGNNSVIALSGAFGDQQYDPIISHEPYVDLKVFELEEGDRPFALAASDALTDGFSERKSGHSDDIKSIGEAVAGGIQEGSSLKDISNQLRNAAIAKLPKGQIPDNYTNILFEILPKTEANQSQPSVFAAVFDGHGGKRVAEDVQQNIVSYVIKGILRKRIAYLRTLTEPSSTGIENEEAAAIGVASEVATQIQSEMEQSAPTESSLLAMAKAIELVITGLEKPEKRAIVAREIGELMNGNLSEKIKGGLLAFAGFLLLGVAVTTYIISHGGSAPVSYKLLPFAHSLIGQGMEALTGCILIGFGGHRWKSNTGSRFSQGLNSQLTLFSASIVQERKNETTTAHQSHIKPRIQ